MNILGKILAVLLAIAFVLVTPLALYGRNVYDHFLSADPYHAALQRVHFYDVIVATVLGQMRAERVDPGDPNSPSVFLSTTDQELTTFIRAIVPENEFRTLANEGWSKALRLRVESRTKYLFRSIR